MIVLETGTRASNIELLVLLYTIGHRVKNYANCPGPCLGNKLNIFVGQQNFGSQVCHGIFLILSTLFLLKYY